MNKKSFSDTVVQKRYLQKHFFRIMRTTAFLLFLFVFCLSAENTNSQNVNVTLKSNNIELEKVLNEIEQQTDFLFVYNNHVNVNRKVSVNLKKASLERTLENLFKGTNVKYSIDGTYILLSANEPNTKSLSTLAVDQQLKRTISGTIKDEKGEPIVGANVVEKGTTNGTITDMNGKFSISVEKRATLNVSYIGYLPQNILVGEKKEFNIQLIEDTQKLEEVVVVGYGTQKKVDLTGSIVSLKGKEIIKSPSMNVENSLIGRLPGVIINNRTGEPGRDDPSIYIRGKSTTGDSSPLILIDGVERGGLGDLNPNDIETVSVLKDASAAIYGARAANGVILVTTKRGGDAKPSINLTFDQGFTHPTRNPKMADSYTYAKVYNEIELEEGRTARYSDDELEKYKNGTDPNYPNTDWFKLFTKTLTPQHRVNLSVSGGNDKVKYYESFSESHQSGIFKYGTTSVRLYNLRSNIDVQLNKYLKIGVNLAGKFNNDHYPSSSTSDIYSHLYLYLPSWSVYWPGTDKLMPCRDSESMMNRVGNAAGTDDEKTTGLQSSVTFRLDIPKVQGLWVDGMASYDASFVYTKIFNTPDYVYYKDSKTGEYYRGVSGKVSSLANLGEKYTNPTNLYFTYKVNYDRTFGVHHVGAMFGYEQQKTKGNYLYAYRSDYVSTSLPEIFAGSSDKNKQSNDGNSSQNARQNMFSRLSYDYSGKYLAQFTFRRDGSPNFPKNKRFGYFPGASIGWRISEESFMKKYTFIDNLKLRASWAKMGNDQVGSYQYLTTYSFGNNYVIGGNDVAGIVQNGVPNPNITWEVAKTTNLGFDARLWKGLLNIEFDYFKTRRSNILTTRSAIIPDYTGLKLPDENVGIVNNKGFELTISHENYANPVKYMVSGNVSFARNKVIFCDEQPAAEPYQYATGHPIGSALYYKAIGIFESQEQINANPHFVNTQPGDVMYADMNNDGTIDARDRIRVDKTNMPEVVYAISGSLEYKGFDFSLLFQGQNNAKQYFDSWFQVMSYSLGDFLQWRADGRWTPENTKATMPRGTSGLWNNNTIQSTQWLLDAGFLRLKNLELGYTLPHKISNKVSLKNVRVSFSANNLLIIYDHMRKLGFDPETSNYWYYPQQRTLNFGINVTF